METPQKPAKPNTSTTVGNVATPPASQNSTATPAKRFFDKLTFGIFSPQPVTKPNLPPTQQIGGRRKAKMTRRHRKNRRTHRK